MPPQHEIETTAGVAAVGGDDPRRLFHVPSIVSPPPAETLPDAKFSSGRSNMRALMAQSSSIRILCMAGAICLSLASTANAQAKFQFVGPNECINCHDHQDER